jgi:hypothetical protein
MKVGEQNKMEPSKYVCRHCRKKTINFDCMCSRKMIEKNLWNKEGRKLEAPITA